MLVALEGLRKDKTIGSARRRRSRITGSPTCRCWKRTASCWPRSASSRTSRSSADAGTEARARAARGESASRQMRTVLELPADRRPDAEHPTLCERCVRVLVST